MRLLGPVLAVALLAACERAPVTPPASTAAVATAAASPSSTPRLGPMLSVPTPTRQLWGDVWLRPEGNSGVEGIARIEADTRSSSASITVTARPGGTKQHIVVLLGGTCARPSASVGRLGTLTADTSGVATLRVDTVEGQGGPRPLTLESIADANHAVAIRDGADTVACGDIPTIGVR